MADFQAVLREFAWEQVQGIAASVDPLGKAEEIIEKIGLTFAIAYGLEAEEVSRATGFPLTPEKTVTVACCSSGQIGRLTARDTLKVVQFRKAKA